MDTDATRESFATPERPPVLPQRLRAALVHRVKDALPSEVIPSVAQFADSQRKHLAPLAVDDSVGAGWVHMDFEAQCGPIASEVRKTIIQHLDAACAACAVSTFDLTMIEMFLVLHHHNGHEAWHDDSMLAEDEYAVTRRIGFGLTLHTEPRLFGGGAYEWQDGTSIDPKNNQLVFWHPLQPRRVQRVELYASDPLAGRWSITGWVHGVPPEGWEAKIRLLRHGE